MNLNLRFRRFECLDSLRDETLGDAVRFLRNMIDNIKKLWRESSVDRAKPFSRCILMVSLASLCGWRSRKTREYPFLMIFVGCFRSWEDVVPVFSDLCCTIFVFYLCLQACLWILYTTKLQDLSLPGGWCN